jgi:glycosyltransferase involved in cell wall biosynthesis
MILELGHCEVFHRGWVTPLKSYGKDELVLKILYELTYATRGQSGVPRDAGSVAKILVNKGEFETDLVLNPRTYTKKSIFRQPREVWESVVLGDALRREPGRSVIPPLLKSGLIFLQSLSLKRKVRIYFLSEKMNSNTLSHLKLAKLGGTIERTRIALISISYLARFSRPEFLKPFILDTSGYDVFIQQQADPISVRKNTIHVVRLHDFLPVTHPQLFDQNAVKVFTKSLRIMLKGKKKIWIMDSESTANEFKAYFGTNQDVRVIPCAISARKFRSAQVDILRKKQICMINTIEPRKRVSLAIAGFREAKKLGKLPDDWNLVIMGGEGWQEGQLANDLRKGLFGKDIIFKELVSDFQAQQVFSESKIVFSTSIAEGFGLPPLEGMMNGCVPVVSDIPQHRETVRENGFYFLGENPEEIAQALGEAAELVESGNSEIANNLKNYVEENYSEQVIGNMWGNLVNSLTK